MMALDWPLHTMLPHSRDMILIDDPATVGDDWAETTVRIGEDAMFCRPGKGVPSWVGIEYMAQTVALYAGAESRRASEAIHIGMLLGTRRYTVNVSWFRVGLMLRIRGTRVWQDERMAVFNCIIDADERLAEAQLNVYLGQELEL
jgi:predicted hotdog family 3-hydroxylacyl-ACP dehydratase